MKKLSALICLSVIGCAEKGTEELDSWLDTAATPVIVVAKTKMTEFGNITKLRDGNGKFLTVREFSLSNVKIGDTLKPKLSD